MKRLLLSVMLTTAALGVMADSSIEGTVKGPNGSPLSGIQVEARRFNGNWWDYVDSVSTDGSGQYTLIGLSAGDYHVRFSDWNGDYIPLWYGNSLDEESAATIVVQEGDTVSNIDARLAPGSKITGTLTDTNGNPLASINVRSIRYNGSWWEEWTSGYTDDSGAYTVGGLPGGKYKIKFQQWDGNYATEFYDDTPFEDIAKIIPVPPLSTVSNINASLGTASRITGKITGPGGTLPLESIAARAYRWDGSAWTEVNTSWTDSNGLYAVDSLPPGQYKVQFQDYNNNYAPVWYSNVLNQSQALLITTTAGNTRSNINAMLAAGAHISGTVTGTNGTTPVSGINVTAFRQGTNSWEWSPGVTSDGSGKYDITGLVSGKYHVVFEDGNGVYMPTWYSNAADIEVATDVVVGEGGNASNINTRLALGAHITGTVTGTNGVTPLADIQVSAFLLNGANLEYRGWAQTDASGFYSVGGLTTGRYCVAFYSPDGEYLEEWYNNQTNWQSAGTVTVATITTVTGINASLAMAGKLSGTVTDSDGAPLKDIMVNQYVLSGGNWVYEQTVATASNGTYAFAGLDGGTNRVQFLDGGGFYMQEWYNNVATFGAATNIVVTRGAQVTGINALLAEAPQTGISGTVTESGSSNALAGIQVTLYEHMFLGDWYWVSTRNVTTDDDGKYKFTGMSAGAYRIGFMDLSWNHVSEYYNDTIDVEVADDIPVSDGAMTTEINAALDPILQTGISGRVTEFGSGIPLAGIDVYVYQDFGSGWFYSGWAGTDTNGDYTFTDLEPGLYRVGFEDGSGDHVSEYYNNTNDVDSADDIMVSDGIMVKGIDADLAVVVPTGISGTVTESGSGPALEGIEVDVFTYDGEGWSYVDTAYTSSNGVYEFTGLAAGVYRLWYADLSGTHIAEYYNNADTVDTADDVTVGDGLMATGIDAALDKVADPEPPVIVGLRKTGTNEFNILFTGTTGRDYVLQETLVMSTNWGDVGESASCADGTNILPHTGTEPKCFWRLRMLP